ncbi:MAG: hypothetical protein LBC95_01175 [Candidatus Nomurabacteria bacterium]|jgi:hypothetical protein|nr:hypothetical protein [Candidatus Nomurabacteria bacterium]
MPSELPVIIRTHELYLAISKVTEKLPGLPRQTIGRRVEDKTLEMLELLTMTTDARGVIIIYLFDNSL